jgi:TonB family protein
MYRSMFTLFARRAAVFGVCCLALATPALAAQTTDTFVSARRLSGALPSTPSPRVIGWIEETLEIVVDATGRVAGTTPLRASPLPADPLVPAVTGWRFRPAVEQGRAVPSRVLVAAVFRPPQLYNTPTLGEPPVDRAPPSGEVPFPISTAAPPYPPLAVGDGVVLVEVRVGLDGRVREPRVVTAASGFDPPALDAAGRWAFRPARRNGRAVEAYAYLLFGFRQPVGAAPAKP